MSSGSDCESGEDVQWAFLELDPIPEEAHDPLAIPHDYQLLHAFKGIKYYQSLGCLKNTPRSPHSITYNYNKVLDELISCVFLVKSGVKTKGSTWPRDIVVQPDALLSGLKLCNVRFSSSSYRRGKKAFCSIRFENHLLTALRKREEKTSIGVIDWGKESIDWGSITDISTSRHSLVANMTFMERQGSTKKHAHNDSFVYKISKIDYFLPSSRYDLFPELLHVTLRNILTR